MTMYAVHDPATLEQVGQAPVHESADVDQAVEDATRAARAWAADRDGRRASMRAAADALRHEITELARILTLEQGKPLAEAEREFGVAAQMLDYYADLEWEETISLPEREGRNLRVQNRPVGLVGTVTPWNFPISLLGVKVAPALAAGCTVISKPSATTPLSTLAYEEVLNRFLPAGVFRVLTGPNRDVNVALSRHPGIRKISFTGSTEVGIAMTQQAAATVKRVTMELGGNDPAILLEDVDVEVAAKGIASSAFRNAGQVCMAVKRVYAPRALMSDLTEALAAEASRLQLGHGLESQTTMGPMHNASQLTYVRELVDAAVGQGAQIAHGGRPGCPLPGHFLEPTVVTGVGPRMRLVAEEQFGAALPIVEYQDLHDLVDELNSQPFGLGASVWADDVDDASRVGEGLDVGTVWINQHTVVEPDAPFGGWKSSGVGRERGQWGLDAYLEQRTINARDLSEGKVKP